MFLMDRTDIPRYRAKTTAKRTFPQGAVPVAAGGFLFTEEVWIVVGVEDWRYNLTLSTPEFIIR